MAELKTTKTAPKAAAATPKTTVAKPSAPKTTAKPATAVKAAPVKKPAVAEKKEPAKTAVKPAATAVKTAVAKPVEVKAEVKTQPKPAAKKSTGKQLKITLIKSTNKCSEKQKRTVIALGLKKIRSQNNVPDNSAIRGMIFVVKHLVKVEEI